MTIKSEASTLSISTSKSSVSPGDTFTVTVSVSGGAGSVTTSVSNGYGGKTEFLDNSSYSFTCTAGNSGSVTISASGLVADYNTEVDESKYASKTVKIVSNVATGGGNSNKNSGGNSNTQKPQEVEKSKDSALSALIVTEAAINPEFNKDVKEYNLNVPYETTAINITATPNDAKAKVDVTGNTDLKEGENIVTITVTAEDGSTSNYTIKVKRARVPLALKSLLVKYTNENGELIEMPLNPAFTFDTLEYSLQDIEYWIEKISVEAEANIEGATIDIQGADNLQIGKNTITVTLKIMGEAVEGQEPQEETIIYTINVNKLEEPTLIAKISNWFKGIFGGVASWYNNNQQKIILGALGVCVVALFGLSIYIVYDYKKYKVLVDKLKKVEELNKTEIVEENIAQNSVTDNFNENSKDANNKKDDNAKGGKHF